MATYASLKYNFGTQLTGEIPSAAIADNAVTLAKMAHGTASQNIAYDGSGVPVDVAASGGGLASVQTFTSNGTWTKPSGIKFVRVQLVASGGGGANWGKASGAGGYSEKLIDVTSISSESVTVGAAPSSNSAGNTSSFGSHCTATGGAIGGTGLGGLGGTGSGGDINMQGGGGAWEGVYSPYPAGWGGVSYFGGGAAGNNTGAGSPNNVTNGAYGAGGGCVHNGYSAHPNPRSGIVIVWEYK
jgi:hypothetical protein